MKKLTLLIVFISFTALAISLTMYNYQCSKCGTVIQAESTPNSSHCPKSSSHNWYKLGEVGDKNYQCGKCGTTIKSVYTPSSSGCPNSSSHSWNKL